MCSDQISRNVADSVYAYLVQWGTIDLPYWFKDRMQWQGFSRCAIISSAMGYIIQ